MSENGISQQIIIAQGERVRKIVESADFGHCPPGMREFHIYVVDALTAILAKQATPPQTPWAKAAALGGTAGAFLSGLAGGLYAYFKGP